MSCQVAQVLEEFVLNALGQCLTQVFNICKQRKFIQNLLHYNKFSTLTALRIMKAIQKLETLL